MTSQILSFVQDRGNAQSSCAGLFILSHLGFDFPGHWVHLDIAAPADVVSIPRLVLPTHFFVVLLFFGNS